jgi:hypothetical protein
MARYVVKKLLLVVSTLPLCSCFFVEDFGTYWDKAGTDKRIAGSWRAIAGENVTLDPDDVMRIVEKGGAYEISVSPHAKDDEPIYPVKTLSVGRYQFLAMGPKQGILVRYRVTGDLLEWCFSDPSSLNQLVKMRYPHAVNMQLTSIVGDYLKISLFDREVVAILSNIPDTNAYWVCDEKYRRVP